MTGRRITPTQIAKAYYSGKRNFDGVVVVGEAGEEPELTSLILDGASFVGADLSGAYIKRCGFLDTDLSGAKLNGAQISGSVFRQAKLKGAELDGTYIGFSRFNGADLRDVRWSRLIFQRTDFRGARGMASMVPEYGIEDGRESYSDRPFCIQKDGGSEPDWKTNNSDYLFNIVHEQDLQ